MATVDTQSFQTTYGYAVGDLVQDESGHRGLVQYIGPVATSKKQTTIWVGVEWEDASRGKHDGAVKDKDGKEHRYFKCDGTKGSFLKPGKVHGGKDFLQAVIEKYQPDLNKIENKQEQAMDNTQDSLKWGNGKTLDIEPVGMDRIRAKQQLENLREVSLPLSGVSHVISESQALIKKQCPNIKTLNLSDNLFRNWNEICIIAKELSNLELLDVSRNPLIALPSNPLTPLPAQLMVNPFDSLKELVLVGTKTSISQIQRLDTQGLLPNLEALFLGKNGLKTLDPIADLKSKEVEHGKGTYAEWAQQQIVEVDRKGFTPASFLTGFVNLLTLDLSDNEIESWSEVWRACRLPKLQTLNVSGNPIPQVFYDEVKNDEEVVEEPTNSESVSEQEEARRLAAEQFINEENGAAVSENPPSAPAETETKEPVEPRRGIMMSNGFVIPIPEQLEKPKANPSRIFKGNGTRGGTKPFIALSFLNLNRARINTWESVDALFKFPALKELRIKEIPLISGTNPGVVRQTVIARVGQIVKLNGSEIRPRERSDAERLYLKRAALDQSKDGFDKAKFLQENPRYDELIKMHGDPVVAAQAGKQNGDGSLASSTMQVTIRTFDPRTCTVPPAVKRLPLTLTVGNLKLLCQRIFGVDASLQKLFYRENKTDFGHPVEMDEDSSQLVYFGVQDGGEIIIEAIDPEKERKDNEKRQQKEEERLAKEEARLQAETERARNEMIGTKLG